MGKSLKTEAARQDGEAKIQAMLEKFAKAFTSGDGKAAGTFWVVPALIVANEGTRAVATIGEVEDFYSGAAKQYNDMGITDTRPEVQSVTWLTDKLASVHVQWPYIGKDGKLRKEIEASTYVLRFDDAGEPKIAVVVMMGFDRG